MNKTKKSLSLVLGLLFIFILIGTEACRHPSKPADVSYYTCPMHPQIRMEQAGQCPICGMDLVPVKKTGPVHEHPPTQTDSPSPETGIQIDPERVQTIGVKTETVEIRDLKMTLNIQGKVASDPKLWVAQKEYLVALSLGDPDLIRAAGEKLTLLGLNQEWIQELRKTRKADQGLLFPVEGAGNFFEAFVSPSDVAFLRPGQRVKILDVKSRFLELGTLRSLGTIANLDSRTLRVLVQGEKYLDLKSNTFVQIQVEVDLGPGLAVSKNAVLFNGDRNIVYVESSPGNFTAREVEIGEPVEAYYQIKRGLEPGEKVVVNGQFLLDSETQLRLGERKEHQH